MIYDRNNPEKFIVHDINSASNNSRRMQSTENLTWQLLDVSNNEKGPARRTHRIKTSAILRLHSFWYGKPNGHAQSRGRLLPYTY